MTSKQGVISGSDQHAFTVFVNMMDSDKKLSAIKWGIEAGFSLADIDTFDLDGHSVGVEEETLSIDSNCEHWSVWRDCAYDDWQRMLAGGNDWAKKWMPIIETICDDMFAR